MRYKLLCRRFAPPTLGLAIFCLTAGLLHSQGTIQPLKPSAPITPLPLSLETQAWLDLDIYRVPKTVINPGADLYNQQSDRAACYRLYQGSLITVRPMLEHPPDLQKAIDNGLADAATKPSMA